MKQAPLTEGLDLENGMGVVGGGYTILSTSTSDVPNDYFSAAASPLVHASNEELYSEDDGASPMSHDIARLGDQDFCEPGENE